MAEGRKEKISELEELFSLTGEENLLLSTTGRNKRATTETMRQFIGENSLHPFADVVDDSVTIVNGTASIEDNAAIDIVYLSRHTCFAQRKRLYGASSYFSLWGSSSNYNQNGVPRGDKAYYCQANTGLYGWNGNELVPLGGGLIIEEINNELDSHSERITDLQTAQEGINNELDSHSERITDVEFQQNAQATQITDMQNKDSQQDNLLKNLDASLNPLKIALSGGGGVYKNGAVQTVTIAWTATKGDAEVAITPTVNGTTLSVGTRNYTEQVSATKTFVVTGTYTYNVMNGVTSTLTAEASTKVTFVDPVKFGFSEVESGVDVNALAYEYVKTSPNGTYTLRADANGYMWLCVPSSMTINKVTMSGFGVPLESPQTIGNYKCYRSSNQLVAGSYTIVIS